MNDWQNFFAAEVGASAALLGLLFVSISINLGRILANRALPNRAFSALLSLLVVLIVSSLLLAPRQPTVVIGAEVLIIGLCAWTAVVIFDVKIWRNTDRAARHRPRSRALTAFDQLAMLLYLLSGLFIPRNGVDGLYWLVPAFLFLRQSGPGRLGFAD